MCERSKIHVFLGAPPASGTTGVEEGQESPADWRHLELTWQDGHLLPATVVQKKISVMKDEGTQRKKVELDGSALTLQQQDRETFRGQDDFNAHWKTAASGSDKQCQRPEDEGLCSASVHEYLEGCFPRDQADEQKPGSEPPSVTACLTAHTQYLTTWTLSQALILRGRCCVQSAVSPEKTLHPQTPPNDARTPPSVSSSTPELFSPITPSLGGSTELFSQASPTLRVKEGGVLIEVTVDGVLCTQEAAQASPSKSPDFKKARISENIVNEASVAPSTHPASLRCPTTLLTQCTRQGVWYSVLVAVVHPCHLKEVKVKHGPAAGTFIPLTTIVVTDQSDVQMKVVLWRRAAFWTLTVTPGDILLITGLQMNKDKWRGETVLQSTFSSKLLNLGQISTSITPPAPQHVNARTFSDLCDFLRARRPLLVAPKVRPLQDLNRLPYITLRSLKVNTLVHALLRVTHTQLSTEWHSEAESRCRSAVQPKAIVTVEQTHGQQGALLLWGAAVDWLHHFNQNRATVWDFHNLLVRESLTAELLELHSTPWSTVKPLDPASQRVQDFFQAKPFQTRTSSSLELDLDTLLSQRYSGDVELRVQITAFRFQYSGSSQNALQLVLDSSTPLDGIVAVLKGDVTYTGCARCSAELDSDTNGIYVPCYPCLPNAAIRRYYRPGVLTVSGRGSKKVCVQVPPVLLQKILKAPPDGLHSSAPGSEVKYIQVVAERIHTLLCPTTKPFIITIRSHFLCDENSVPISLDFTLLDLQFHPGSGSDPV